MLNSQQNIKQENIIFMGVLEIFEWSISKPALSNTTNGNSREFIKQKNINI